MKPARRAFVVGGAHSGFIGKFHARNIRDIARSGANAAPLDVDYYAACDRDQTRATAFAEHAGCRSRHHSYPGFITAAIGSRRKEALANP